MSDEQRVRTMAGWVGVEISKSRVRTRGKAGHGLYRVRTAAERHWHVPHPKVGPDGEWTGYLFTLDEIERAVEVAIGNGLPSGPQDLLLAHPSPKQGAGEKPVMTIATRWTWAYEGKRNLGASEVERAATSALGEQLETDTVRSRQRAQNAAFQAEHKERRDYGLKRRHAEKLRRNAAEGNP